MTVADTIKDAVGLGHAHAEPSGPATAAQMSDARLPLAYRDSCAHLLIPLNKCRKQEWYMPWKCEHERHSYEQCQYDEFKKRVKKMDEIVAAQKAQKEKDSS